MKYALDFIAAALMLLLSLVVLLVCGFSKLSSDFFASNRFLDNRFYRSLFWLSLVIFSYLAIFLFALTVYGLFTDCGGGVVYERCAT